MNYRDPDWLAEKLGIDRNTVYRMLQEGVIPAVQIGRKWLISEDRVEAWLNAETDRQTRQRRDATRGAEPTVRRMDSFTGDARAALKRAHSAARQMRHVELDSLHLLLGLVIDGKSAAGRAMRSLGVKEEVIRRALEKLERGNAPPARRLPRNPQAKRAMRLASRMALKEGEGNPLSPVGTDHLLTGVFLARQSRGHALLVERGVTRASLREALKGERS